MCCTHTCNMDHMEAIFKKLECEGKKARLRINIGKTKLLTNNQEDSHTVSLQDRSQKK